MKWSIEVPLNKMIRTTVLTQIVGGVGCGKSTTARVLMAAAFSDGRDVHFSGPNADQQQIEQIYTQYGNGNACGSTAFPNPNGSKEGHIGAIANAIRSSNNGDLIILEEGNPSVLNQPIIDGSSIWDYLRIARKRSQFIVWCGQEVAAPVDARETNTDILALHDHSDRSQLIDYFECIQTQKGRRGKKRDLRTLDLGHGYLARDSYVTKVKITPLVSQQEQILANGQSG